MVSVYTGKKQLRTLKLTDDLWERLRARAAEKPESMTAVVERALARELGSAPATATPVRLKPDVPVLRSDTTRCSRCGHPAAKHTPVCYVMGCVCRSLRT